VQQIVRRGIERHRTMAEVMADEEPGARGQAVSREIVAALTL